MSAAVHYQDRERKVKGARGQERERRRRDGEGKGVNHPLINLVLTVGVLSVLFFHPH